MIWNNQHGYVLKKMIKYTQLQGIVLVEPYTHISLGFNPLNN